MANGIGTEIAGQEEVETSRAFDPRTGILTLEDGSSGTAEQLGVVVPPRAGQVDSEPARDIAPPPPSRLARQADLVEKYGEIGVKRLHADDSPTPTAIMLTVKMANGTVINTEGATYDEALDKLIAKMDVIGEALLA